ncbi:Retrovirus-related Pol polyprotein from type-1 retrotransposable element R2 [Araneus ventricosus]|uniref:Retrovirus-related Pol polyprotein from type-1 retrotransposable element R2 n=1 Tax=Araneus ventricosus TaxID=182803 RepID=A0A4Y2QHT5_ARAVE|nr:Retrovirus-related Pol polyprotein from type-1 retrotransposable element R2 [Araneus ventricosus]
MHRRKDAENSMSRREIPKPKQRRRNNKRRTRRPGQDVNPSGDKGAIDDPTISLAAPVIQETLPPTPPADREDRPLLTHILSELSSLCVDDTSEGNFLSFCILRLYTRNPKRAVWMITGEDGARCTLDTDTLFDYFSGTWGAATSDPAFYEETQETRTGVLDRDFSVAEVVKLRNAENSAAGPDRLTYHHWRTVDPAGKTLTKIFNLCLFFRRIPPSWKETKTVLIPKKSVDPALPANWRLIALYNTIYKLFTKCITGRLTSWCERYGAISKNQKGFMPHHGVLEHNFTLQERFNDARDKRKDFCAAWLDVSNAFGSLPHCAIQNALQAARVGDALCSLFADMYSGCTTRILSNDSCTNLIQILSGVKQGCPLSGILFNMAIDPALRRLQANSNQHKVLAFADDLALLADGPQELQTNLDLIHDGLARIGLRLNPSKSVVLHIGGSVPVGARETNISIGGTPLTVLAEFDRHRFLGKPVGFSVLPDYASLKTIVVRGNKLIESGLAPWQIMEALKKFHYSSLQFAMRTAQFGKSDWDEVDRTIRPGIKSTLSLPENAANECLYGSRSFGCRGIPIAEDISLRPAHRRKVLFTIRDRLRTDRRATLIITKKHKGKVMDCVSLHPASSHFYTNGDFTRFCDFRFSQKCRLGVGLGLNGYKTWKPPQEQLCRFGHKELETLPHVLNHCWGSKTRGYQLRHNCLVGRIKKAAERDFTIVYENQRIPGTDLRPDLVIENATKIFLIDVTFEHRREAFDKARERKHVRYNCLLELMKKPGKSVEIVPFVMGSWDPQIDPFMRNLCSRSYLKLFQKLCVSDTLRWSRDLFVEHVTGVRQYDPAAFPTTNYKYGPAAA